MTVLFEPLPGDSVVLRALGKPSRIRDVYYGGTALAIG